MNRFMIILILVILAGFACREEPTKPPTAEFTLTAEDIGVTDIFFRLKATLSHGPFTVLVKRDGDQIYQSQSTNLITVDTLLYDESLLPKQNYTYKAYYTIGGEIQDSSAPMVITTMDTTSHDFSWEIFYLGDGGGSVLYDVAIVNDTCVYAVGEIYKKDSLGNWETEPYNAVKWDGIKWNLLRIPTEMYGGYIGHFPLNTVIGFSQNDIWTFSTAGSYSHWNGIRWSTKYVAERSGGGTKFWGTSSSNIYLVGTNGSITHYNGLQWRRLESGTDVNLTDVWGSPDGSVVWACGYHPTKWGTFLLKCVTNSWSIAVDGTELEDDIMEDTLSGTFTSLYTPSKYRLYVGSSAGLYYVHSVMTCKARRYSFTNTCFPGFPNSLRGNGVNDMVIVGDYSMVAHFNGVTWRYFNELRTNNIAFLSVAQKGDLIVAVGYNLAGRGIIFLGRR